jgi:hypothetical protein
MKEPFYKLKSEIQKKKKEKEEIKVKLDLGELIRPREENQPAAHYLQTRTGTPAFSPPRRQVGPTCHHPRYHFPLSPSQ